MNEAELLFTHVLKCDRSSLYLDRSRKLDPSQSAFIADTLRRRAAGEPLEYILGLACFMGMDFRVDRRVLIPRPETELLVEAAAARAKTFKEDITIADIGTGCGNIAVSLAAFLPSAKIIATDISGDALALAKENAAANGCGGRITFLLSDLLTSIADGSCSMIVSNPPYVRTGDIGWLQPEVRREPPQALDGGEDGFVFYRRIAEQAHRCLKAGGLLLMEMGFGQLDGISPIVKDAGFEVLQVINDYSGIERVIVAAKV